MQNETPALPAYADAIEGGIVVDGNAPELP